MLKMDSPAQWKKGPRPDPSVIEFLAQLQEAARKGHIRSIAVITVNPLLEVENAHAGELDNVKRHLLLGGLIALSRNIQP
jgi:hypothetical protein